MYIHPAQLALAKDTDPGRKILMTYDGPKIDHSESIVCMRVQVEYWRSAANAKVPPGAFRHRIVGKNFMPGRDGEVLFIYNDV
jgi:hypothetical protein